MLNSDPHPDIPTALSFRDFRDKEIVGFFANEHRTFRPMSVPGSRIGGQCLVGNVHPPSAHKPTAAFRTTLAVAQKETSVLHRSPTPSITLPSANSNVELPFGKPARPLGTIVLAGRKPTANNGRAAKVLVDPLAAFCAKTKGPKSPCPTQSGIQIDGSIKNLGEKSLTHTDGELAKLVEHWPRLSPALKEFIGTLVSKPDV